MTSEVVNASENQPVVNVAPAEKMMAASEVTELVKERTAHALEKGRREERARIEAEMAQTPQGMTKDEARKLLREEMATVVQEGMKQQSTQNFVSKIKGAELDEFPGLSAKVARHAKLLEPLVPFLEGVENTSAVTSFLVENPTRAHQLKMMVLTGDVESAEEVIKHMSSTLKEDGSAYRPSKQPLSNVKPSSAGGDKGERSISELAKDKLYRC